MREAARAAIDQELATLIPAEGILRGPVEYALGGGKRARGLLLLASGLACVPEPMLLRAAASLELLHAATLVQDDIFDRSRTRRSRAATHCVFGPQVATLASDWMLAEAIHSAYRLHLDWGEALSRAAQAVIAGEALELAPGIHRDFASLRAEVAAVAKGKTGELFGLAVCAPSLLGGSGCAKHLHELGCALGVAFQYLDDAMDLYGDGDAAGKQLHRDLPAHLLTLPTLDALALLPLKFSNVAPRSGLPLPAYLKSAFDEATVREQILLRARGQWAEALRSLGSELPDGEAVEALLSGLAARMLPSTEKPANLTAA